jgi:hypothetical protein
MENLDPQETPGTPGTEEGQPAEPAETPEPQPVDKAAQELERLKAENEKLQHRLTQRGRELKQLNQQPPVTQEPAAEGFDWENPGASIGKYISKAFGDFETRQEQRRQAEELLRHTAEERGIPVPKLQEYYTKLQEASQDPYELMDTVARMYQADHTDAAITEAKRTMQENTQRNARGVTAEGSSTQPIAPQKPIDDMNDEELEAYVERTYGRAEWPA